MKIATATPMPSSIRVLRRFHESATERAMKTIVRMIKRYTSRSKNLTPACSELNWSADISVIVPKVSGSVTPKVESSFCRITAGS